MVLLLLPFRRQFLHEINHLLNQEFRIPKVLMKWNCPEYERINLPRLDVNIVLEDKSGAFSPQCPHAISSLWSKLPVKIIFGARRELG